MLNMTPGTLEASGAVAVEQNVLSRILPLSVSRGGGGQERTLSSPPPFKDSRGDEAGSCQD